MKLMMIFISSRFIVSRSTAHTAKFKQGEPASRPRSIVLNARHNDCLAHSDTYLATDSATSASSAITMSDINLSTGSSDHQS